MNVSTSEKLKWDKNDHEIIVTFSKVMAYLKFEEATSDQKKR